MDAPEVEAAMDENCWRAKLDAFLAFSWVERVLTCFDMFEPMISPHFEYLKEITQE